MNLKQLQYFSVLAEELHFRRAAEKLNITQSPLSIAIQNLEQELGAKLFHRNQRSVQLTEVGRRLYDHAQGLISRLEHCEQDIRAIVNGKAGQLRIAFTAASSLLSPFPKLISAFQKKFPEIDVQLQSMTTVQQISALSEGTIDIGLLRRPRQSIPAEISTRRLATDRLVVALPSGHPLTSKSVVAIPELAKEKFIFFPRKMGIGIYDQFIKLCGKWGFAPDIVQEAEEATTIVGLVAAGLGVAVVPGGLRYIQIPNLEFRHIADEDAITELLLAFRTGEANLKVQQLVHLAQQAFSTEAGESIGAEI